MVLRGGLVVEVEVVLQDVEEDDRYIFVELWAFTCLMLLGLGAPRTYYGQSEAGVRGKVGECFSTEMEVCFYQKGAVKYQPSNKSDQG
jgi:hypothetical protein